MKTTQLGIAVAVVAALGIVGGILWRKPSVEVAWSSDPRSGDQVQLKISSPFDQKRTKADALPPPATEKQILENRVAQKSAPTTSMDEKDRARLAQARKLVLRRYGALFGQLGLTPDQREKLTQLLVDEREASVDFAAANAASGRDSSQDQGAFAQAVYDLREQIHGQMKTLLGDEAYVKFVAGDESIRQSAVVERMQKELKAAGGRLDEQQSAQLLGVMQNLRVTIVNEAVVARAGAFLTPDQLAALQNLQQRRLLGVQKEVVQAAISENLANPDSRSAATAPKK